MIAVIQCAARKRANAGYLQTPAGERVAFVAHPRDAPPDGEAIHAHPDGESGYGGSWRDVLSRYNANASSNPLHLLPAWQLYDNRTYARLVKHVGVRNLYILSAGWGLIRADFLTPYYDITFSASTEPWKRRRQTDRYEDFNMLDVRSDDILFWRPRCVNGGPPDCSARCRLHRWRAP